MRGFDLRIIGLAFAGMALLLPCAAAAQTTSEPLPSASSVNKVIGMDGSIRALFDAMRQGDPTAAVRIYQSATNPVLHVLAAMVLERIHFNLDAANADAKICEDSLFDSKPGIALFCGQFRSGNLRLAGKRAEADDVERELVKRYQGRGFDKALAGMHSYLTGDEAASPALTYERPAGNVSVSLKEDAWIPTFKATANGHDLDLMLDTGANDLYLGADQAQALGVQPLNRKMRVSGWLSKNVQAQRGLLDELKIGGITLRHVPVMVVPQPIALIGANLVAPLGTLRVSHKDLTLTFYGVTSSTPECNTPMMAATNLWGTSVSLLPQLLVNDAPHAVFLDTGDHEYLSGTKQALAEVELLHRGKTTVHDIGGVHPFASAERAKIKLTIAGQPIEMYFAAQTDSTMPHDITIGAGALRDMDFLLDFRHQRMCFLLHPDLH